MTLGERVVKLERIAGAIPATMGNWRVDITDGVHKRLETMESGMDRAELVAKHPGYRWVIDRGLVGWTAFTALQPWHFLPEEEMFYATERWPSGPSGTPLLVFARRQDCDDLACFEEGQGNASKVVLIEGWSGGGSSYDIIESFPTFWEWMKAVIDDIADWSALPGRK